MSQLLECKIKLIQIATDSKWLYRLTFLVSPDDEFSTAMIEMYVTEITAEQATDSIGKLITKVLLALEFNVSLATFKNFRQVTGSLPGDI